MIKTSLKDVIVPTHLDNSIKGIDSSETPSTDDLIYIESSSELGENPIKKECNDFSFYYGTRLAKQPNPVQVLRDFYVSKTQTIIPVVDANNKVVIRNVSDASEQEFFSPAMRVDIKKYFELTGLNPSNFLTKKTLSGKKVQTLALGKYPQSKASPEAKKKLLNLVLNNEKNNQKPYVLTLDSSEMFQFSDHLNAFPVYELEGKEYVDFTHIKTQEKNNKTYCNTQKEFFEIEPVEYIIKNWARLPKNINPKGTGEDNFFELSSEKLFSYQQFSAGLLTELQSSWHNSSNRTALNGINAEDLSLYDSIDQEYIRSSINETFINATLNPLPVVETHKLHDMNYVPTEELNRLPVKQVILNEEMAISGPPTDFKYVYINNQNQTVLSKEKLKNSQYKPIITLSQLSRIYGSENGKNIKDQLVFDKIKIENSNYLKYEHLHLIEDYNLKHAYIDKDGTSLILSKNPPKKNEYGVLTLDSIYDFEYYKNLLNTKLEKFHVQKVEVPDSTFIENPEYYEALNKLFDFKYAYLEDGVYSEPLLCFSEEKPKTYLDSISEFYDEFSIYEAMYNLNMFKSPEILIDHIGIDSSTSTLIKKDFLQRMHAKYFYFNENGEIVFSTKKPIDNENVIKNLKLTRRGIHHEILNLTENLTPILNKITFKDTARISFPKGMLKAWDMNYLYASKEGELTLSKDMPKPQQMSPDISFQNSKYFIDVKLNFEGENLINEIYFGNEDSIKSSIDSLNYKYLYSPKDSGYSVYSNKKPDLKTCDSAINLEANCKMPLTEFSGEYLFDKIRLRILETAKYPVDLAQLGFKYLYVDEQDNWNDTVYVSKIKPESYSRTLDLTGSAGFGLNEKAQFHFSGESLIKKILPSQSSDLPPGFLKSLGMNYLSRQHVDPFKSTSDFVYTQEKPKEQDIERTYHVSSNRSLQHFNFDGEILIDNLAIDQHYSRYNGVEIEEDEAFEKLGIKFSYVDKDNLTLILSKNKPMFKTPNVWHIGTTAFKEGLKFENNINQICFLSDKPMKSVQELRNYGFNYLFVDKNERTLSVSKEEPAKNSYLTTYTTPPNCEILEIPKFEGTDFASGNLIETIVFSPFTSKVISNDSGFKYVYVDKKSGNLAIGKKQPKKYNKVYEVPKQRSMFPILPKNVQSLIEGISFTPKCMIPEDTCEQLGFEHLSVSKKTGKLFASNHPPKPRQMLDAYTLPKNLQVLQRMPKLANTHFNKLVLHDDIRVLDDKALTNLSFANVYVNNNNEIVFSSEKPEKGSFTALAENIDMPEVFKLDSLANNSSPYKWLIMCKNPTNYINAINTMQKAKINFPIPFLKQLESSELFDQFFKESKFKNFKTLVKQTNKLFDNTPIEDAVDFYKLITNLGCFSAAPLLNKKGLPTADNVGRKATELVKQVLAYKPNIHSGHFHPRFTSLRVNLTPNQNLLAFLAHKDNKTMPNIDMLLGLEYKYKDIIPRVITNFDRVQELHENAGINEQGIPVSRSWEDAIKAMYSETKFLGVTEETKHIAETYVAYGIDRQEVFEEGVRLHEEAKKKNIPNHILSVHLKEKTITEQINEIIQNTSEMLAEDVKIIEEKLRNQFTYEMLSKDDPLNGIIGAAASCCGTINSIHYGSDIAKATIRAKDVQNLVVRNSEGKVVAKGSMYVNKDVGYAVINDFEINNLYKMDEVASGYYKDKNPELESQRQAIFDAFMRGIYAFVKQYDKENPEKPLQEVAVGWTYNRLKKQCAEFASIAPLRVPSEYNFSDAKQAQHLLYNRLTDLSKLTQEQSLEQN